MIFQYPLHRLQNVRAQRQSVVRPDLPFPKQMCCLFLSHELRQCAYGPAKQTLLKSEYTRHRKSVKNALAVTLNLTYCFSYFFRAFFYEHFLRKLEK